MSSQINPQQSNALQKQPYAIGMQTGIPKDTREGIPMAMEIMSVPFHADNTIDELLDAIRKNAAVLTEIVRMYLGRESDVSKLEDQLEMEKRQYELRRESYIEHFVEKETKWKHEKKLMAQEIDMLKKLNSILSEQASSLTTCAFTPKDRELLKKQEELLQICAREVKDTGHRNFTAIQDLETTSGIQHQTTQTQNANIQLMIEDELATPFKTIATNTTAMKSDIETLVRRSSAAIRENQLAAEATENIIKEVERIGEMLGLIKSVQDILLKRNSQINTVIGLLRSLQQDKHEAVTAELDADDLAEDVVTASKWNEWRECLGDWALAFLLTVGYLLISHYWEVIFVKFDMLY